MIIPGMGYRALARHQSKGLSIQNQGMGSNERDAHGTNGCLRELLREGSELLIEHLAPLSFLLLHLYFVFVAVSVLALAVTGFVELDVRSLPEELHILTK
jgi:hypothetical protein